MEAQQRTSILRALPLFIIIFIGFLGYSLLITILTPLILNDTGGVLASVPFEANRLIVLGVVLALYPLGQFFGSPVLGSLSDRFGRRPVLLISLFITTLGYAGFAYALKIKNLPLFMFISLVIGLSEANIVIAQSAIADITTRLNRTRMFAYINLSASGAFVIGPLVGGMLADSDIVSWFGYDTPFWAVFALLFLTTLVTFPVFKETRPEGKRREVRIIQALTNLLTVFTEKRLRIIYFINFIIYFSVFGFFRSFPMYMVEVFGMGVSRVSVFIAWNAVPVVISSLWIIGYLARRYSSRTITIFSSMLFGISTLALTIPEPEWTLWITLFFPGLMLAIALPACTSMLSFMVVGEEQGSVLGNNLSLQVMSEVLSGLAAGFLAAYLIELPLYVCGVIAIFAGIVLWGFIKVE